ncbi:TIGR03557 family F420-dependent LLM class oxidoreductase [Mycolicibacterium sp. S2-37]|uniref:TIGR03557 family F420-dependent LLM class oxidoreductase n=1 Tax=Mycolicibacterium sp. S2-37 TaxID=2810297 RepID=UPI001A94ECE0|nr:TIGR03557 family F420-dependent LLM class oxidoreductase [Mycolicibacterium sp. S2-37]MBO0679900.1 TIGR03557 family F420-dependent LLM class oxidoreductase [Mycolicibacterium sp. S2-37]
MAEIGYFLSCEQYTPAELIDQAKRAEAAGFEALWISDHFHPWNDEQGQSAFVWGVIGALSQVTSLPVSTAVTCPTIRIHPAIIAQAAATAAVQLDGRFVLGVGSGEALNEHVLGDPWPSVGVRLEMLEEAIDVIRLLHKDAPRGREVSHHGLHYEVQDARIYTLPDNPVPIYVSGFGPQAAEFAGRIGDGFCTTMPDADLIKTFRESGGGDKPVQAGTKVSWDRDADTGLDAAHRLWPNEVLPGQLAQTLPRPKDFADVGTLVPRDMVGGSMACGPDADKHVSQIREFIEAGADEVYVQQVGPDIEGFFSAWERDVLPQLRS